MRPILYNKNETRFDTYGLGEIDALKGNATRERNGNYSAYLEYPASGPLASVFEKEMKFKADAGTRTKNQTFEIVRVVKDSSSTIKIYAQHISHKLEYMSIRHGIKVSGTADLALKTWAKNLIGDYRFDTWSDIDTALPVTFLVDKMENARLALGGVEGSILDIWGGEYEFDNQTVRLHKRLGRRAPTVLEYGRNILSAESDESIESAYTSVVPFATYTPESPEGDSRQQDPVLVTIPESYVDSKYVSMYANRRIKVVDFSSEFKDEGAGESKKKDIPTPEKLKALAVKYMDSNRIGAPKINTKIEYVDLAQTLDYAERGWIEELELCDIVPVYYPEIGITEDDAKVTKVVYDFLNDRNESVEFGMVGESIRSAMTGGLAGRLDDLEKSQQSLENRQSEMAFELPKYLLDAKGNRVWNETPDENIEHKVGDIWFEKNGLYQRLYIWNGEMWEKRIDTEDVSKVGEKFDAEVKKINQSMATQNQQTTQALRTAGANASAIEAAKGAITKLNQDLAGAKQTNQAAIDRLKSDFASAQKVASDQATLLKSDLANISTKQSQAESEIAKQVSALNQTKTELAGVKSAQVTFEQSTTRRLAELANVADGKASKSELVQTTQELSSRIASVQVGSSRNYFKNSRIQSFTTNEQATYDYRLFIAPDFWKNQDRLKRDYVRLSFDVTFPVALARDMPAMVHFSATPWYSYKNLVFKGGTTERQHFEFTIDLSSAAETYQTNNVFIRFGTNYGFPSGLQVVIENAMLSIGNYYPAYQPAYEDQDERVSAIESSFKQRADSLEAGVSSLREGLKTKADSSALTVLSDSIKQSVKSLEADTQNKLDSKLSTAEFAVRASGIRQEILNATKDKADKALVTAEAGKLREELASLSVGGRNLMGIFNTTPVKASFGSETYRFEAKTTKNTTRPTLQLQFRWTDGTYSAVVWVGQEGVFKKSFRITKDYTELRIKFNCNKEDAVLLFKGNKFIELNTDYLFTGDLLNLSPNDSVADFLKIEKATIPSDWSPALEDIDGLITEAKATFERTAQGLRQDLTAVQAYVSADGTRAEALRTYSREETARQLTALRQSVESGYVAKAEHTEDVLGLTRRFEELKTRSDTKLAEYKHGIDGQLANVQSALNTANGSLTSFNNWKQSAQETLNKVGRVETGLNETKTSLAEFKRTAEGQLSTITQQVSGKANQTEFQRVQETSKLYERLIGSTEKEVTDKVSRIVMTNQLFQTEVSKNQGLRTVQSQLAGSWSIKNLNSASDILGQLNLNPDGSISINEGLISIGDKTHIKNGVIKNAMIESMLADKITAGTLNAANVNIINLNANKIVGLDANFIRSKIELAFIEWMKGKKISAINDKTVFDLNEGTLNLFSNTGTIRRIDNTSSSQFLKFEQNGFIGEHLRDEKAARIVIGTNHDRTENTENKTFAGSRLWSGSKNGTNESLYEFVSDRIIFYSNGQFRSPWIIHNNTRDGNSYLIPMNENGVRHNLGRGDKHFGRAYIDEIFVGKESRNVGTYLWDILTCFGVLSRYGWDLKHPAVQNHIRSSLINKYGFK